MSSKDDWAPVTTYVRRRNGRIERLDPRRGLPPDADATCVEGGDWTPVAARPAPPGPVGDRQAMLF
jgi:hypothetical protein